MFCSAACGILSGGRRANESIDDDEAIGERGRMTEQMMSMILFSQIVRRQHVQSAFSRVRLP